MLQAGLDSSIISVVNTSVKRVTKTGTYHLILMDILINSLHFKLQLGKKMFFNYVFNRLTNDDSEFQNCAKSFHLLPNNVFLILKKRLLIKTWSPIKYFQVFNEIEVSACIQIQWPILLHLLNTGCTVYLEIK